MTEALAGVLQQAVQQASNQSAVNSASQKTGSGNFESFMSQDGKNPTQPGVTGNGIQDKLDQLQGDLAMRHEAGKKVGTDPDSIPVELLDSKSRMGLLREAYQKIGTAERSGGFESRFVQVESEYKEVEAIMSSDKNLSPGELLALQARLYQVSQHIEVMSKVVDQMAGGIKTVLNTNI